MVEAASDAYNYTGIYTYPYTKWQKSRPIPIPELKNCNPSERHLCTRHFLGVNPPDTGFDESPPGLAKFHWVWQKSIGSGKNPFVIARNSPGLSFIWQLQEVAHG